MTAAAPAPSSASPPASAAPQTQGKRGMSAGWVRLGLVLTGALLLGAGAVWRFLAPVEEQPEERLAAALRHIDAGETAEARTIAQELEEQGFRSSDFPGGVEYVLGMAAFQLAEAEQPAEGASWNAVAAVYLKEAEHRGLPDERRPEWCFALGKTLAVLGDTAVARPLLAEAVETYPPQRIQASLLLAELLLDAHADDTEPLQQALRLTEQALRELDSHSDQYPRALLLHGELMVALEQFPQAEAIAQRLLALDDSGRPWAALLKAQAHLAQRQYDDTLRLLETLAHPSEAAVDAVLARRALYLQGLAAESRAEELAASQSPTAAARVEAYRQRAQDAFQTLLDQFERTPEALAALVHLGRLQLLAGAHEKALQSFGAALRAVDDVPTYRNRWLHLEEFRNRILAAWHDWNQAGRFEIAIALAELMSPLFSREQADELAALTRQRWAESVAAELEGSTAASRAQRSAELRRLWRDSGAAFARLAEARRAADRPQALWISADHYFRGHDFATALQILDDLLRDPPEGMRPMAMVRRGEVLLNLDRVEEAIRVLEEVLQTNATSPSAFRAQYLLGLCRLERDDAAGAEEAWRKLLNSPDLHPTAVEWREALLATGQLRVELAALERRKTQSRDVGEADRGTAWTRMQEFAHDAARLLEEFLARYPDSPRHSEAQYALAKALQLQAEWQHHQWELGETENARQQARRQQQIFLTKALTHLAALRERLTALAKADRLDPPGRTLLANAWFDYPALCIQLERYDDAIAAYSAAANQYPQDVRVLTAYLQMARAYALSGRPIEARSMLEQAQVILDQRQVPDSAFLAPTTSLTRAEWNEWLDRARQVQR
jgi:tetratricopeptide (TPR) repeat protein